MSLLLPDTFDNKYRGHRVALWLFGLLLLMKTAMGINCAFNGRTILITADGVPVDTYPPAAAQTIVALFALYGFFQLLLSVLGTGALVRYRSAVPLMFAVFLLEHAGRKLILWLIPMVRVGHPPATAVNLALLILILAGLALSLWKRG